MGDLRRGQRALGHRVVVVLGGDLHPARGQPAHRVVPAVVAEGELVGRGAEGGGQQLVAKADPEHRHRPCAARARISSMTPGRAAGSPGPLERKIAVGLEGQDLVGGGGRRNHGHRGQLAELAQHGLLDAEVVGHHPVRPVAPGEGGRSWSRRHQVDAVGGRGGAGRGHQVRLGRAVPKAQGMDPGSRRWRVSRRVSMPVIPGTETGPGTPPASPSTASCWADRSDRARSPPGSGDGSPRRRWGSPRSSRCGDR